MAEVEANPEATDNCQDDEKSSVPLNDSDIPIRNISPRKRSVLLRCPASVDSAADDVSREPVRSPRSLGPPGSVIQALRSKDNSRIIIRVASPPDKRESQDDATVQYPRGKNGQLSKQGSLTILRRSSSRSLSGRGSRLSSQTDDDALDSLDLSPANLPPLESAEACEKAALRLRSLLRRLRLGEIPATLLQHNLQYAADVLETCLCDDTKCDQDTGEAAITISIESSSGKCRRGPPSARGPRRLADEEDELSEVEPDAVPPEVREWLASTFTRQLSTSRRKNDEKPKFRSVANAIRAGIFVERIYRRLSSATFLQLPPEVTRILKGVDDWNFDVFLLQEASNNTPLRCLAYELLNRYGLLHKFKIPPATLESFLNQIEAGYCKYKNPYHNNVHAADVLQTIHYMLSQTGLMNWLNDVEILATLIAALIHDFEHTGTTNNFHVMSGSDTAYLYNDRAVLENHHISAAFRLMKEDENNIVVNLSREEYREFRSLVIDMVLATDMSSHFQQIKAMKSIIALQDASLDKSKALSLVLHCCDISHPSKRWLIHERWTRQLLEEFFRQGDKERELGLPYSPLCDRNNTLVAESQIGFIDFIVEPSMGVCGDLLDRIVTLSTSHSTPTIAEETHNEPGGPIKRPVRGCEVRRPWQERLSSNKIRWKENATRDAELRARQQKVDEEALKENVKEEEEEEESQAESTEKEDTT
ncbi:dual specificity calcium/calmodulin-dependent 3',5'-cyclic nucleotide phosphodiesterase 1A-like isoform X2 [Oratosquilla oratoria]|uniref:dual specificity calcium/calmodulin-dependent 3',5'-cyclic nucleotide phosphodiesterase 1A-like isoform X2 n=1 Tax=Oratosquilla oratoria TaxID=337810 RepID=UPI003F761A80